ncbi:hypothetical protein [Maribacter sp. 2307UL18-2]|uniref:hypothetical protein n=1 Tax=Maribacter sp. 2307UL18-2 TaxID=3386274 RepID=UPI0039BC3478
MYPRLKYFFLFFTVLALNAQKSQTSNIATALEKYGLTEQRIISENDTVVYYLKAYTTKPDKLVVFIQGTDPFPIFFNQRSNGELTPTKTFNSDYRLLDSTYAYAIVAKPGLSGIFQKEGFTVPKKYHDKNYREYRVAQIDASIDDILENHMVSPKKVVVYGHSEGAQIASSLALKNEHITHLGFWSGNVLNNFYEFALFERIAALKGQQNDSTAHENIMGLLGWYQSIITNPNSTEMDNWGFTNKRWSSYEEAPLNNLLKIDIPIYTLFATLDESTPIETAYLLPVQFLQKRKNNLSFNLCMGCDHSYQKKNANGMESQWEDEFKEFISWTDL